MYTGFSPVSIIALKMAMSACQSPRHRTEVAQQIIDGFPWHIVSKQIILYPNPVIIFFCKTFIGLTYFSVEIHRGLDIHGTQRIHLNDIFNPQTFHLVTQFYKCWYLNIIKMDPHIEPHQLQMWDQNYLVQVGVLHYMIGSSRDVTLQSNQMNLMLCIPASSSNLMWFILLSPWSLNHIAQVNLGFIVTEISHSGNFLQTTFVWPSLPSLMLTNRCRCIYTSTTLKHGHRNTHAHVHWSDSLFSFF